MDPKPQIQPFPATAREENPTEMEQKAIITPTTNVLANFLDNLSPKKMKKKPSREW